MRLHRHAWLTENADTDGDESYGCTDHHGQWKPHHNPCSRKADDKPFLQSVPGTQERNQSQAANQKANAS